MIVKKIKSDPKRAKSKAAHVRDLTDYIRNPSERNRDEKVLYERGRGFLCEEHDAQQAEMVALAEEAVKSPNPVSHWVLSWREGEQPSPAQVEGAVDIFLAELGLSEHQSIYALHQDTDNLHLHVAVNRVHPETLKVLKPNGGFDIEAAHRAVARIEHAQGWERERRGRYHVLENGELGREHVDPTRPREPEQRKRDMEQRTGEKSAERIAIERGAPVLKAARSWAELHEELGKQGLRYEKTGSGATMFVGEVGVKASRVDRGGSLSKLETRLGAYEPAGGRVRVAERGPELLGRDGAGEGALWVKFGDERRVHYEAKGDAVLKQRVRHERERQELSARQKARRGELFGEAAGRGQGELRNQMRSLVAAEQASEKAELKERQGREREQVRQRFPAFPDLEHWLREHRQPELADRWRYRHEEPMRIQGAELGEGAADGAQDATARDIRAYTPEVRGGAVHYFHKGLGRGQGAAFVDRGRQVEVYAWQDRDSVRAALQLGAQKWGALEVWGNDEYKLLCAELAAEHGFKIVNPELERPLQEARLERRGERGRGVERLDQEEAPEPVRSAEEAYRRHRQEVLREHDGRPVNASRVDALVAVRMRATGYGQGEIADAVRHGAPAAGRAEGSLDQYAARAAGYAFGAGARGQALAVTRLTSQWLRVEGRQAVHDRVSELERGPERGGWER